MTEFETPFVMHDPNIASAGFKPDLIVFLWYKIAAMHYMISSFCVPGTYALHWIGPFSWCTSSVSELITFDFPQKCRQ